VKLWLGGKNSLRRNVVALVIFWPWLFVALVRFLALDSGWPMIPLVSFIPQTLVTLVIPLAFALLLRARWTAIAIGVTALLLAVVIAPRAISDGDPATQGRELRIFTGNLKKGHAEPAPLYRAIRSSKADVITLQEASDSNIAELRALGLIKTHPYVVEAGEESGFANFTISRWPMTENKDSFARTGRWTGIRLGGGGRGLTFYNFHSRSPTDPSREAEWSAALGSLPGSRSIDGQLRIISGDFNATVDHRAFRSVLARGYQDAGSKTGNGLKWTWQLSRLTRLVIDHVLYPDAVEIESYEVVDLPGSDHRGLAVTLRLPGRG
jgi:endonuclease/exonuclease/phosphatase (EEP) superfamily protein YafD